MTFRKLSCENQIKRDWKVLSKVHSHSTRHNRSLVDSAHTMTNLHPIILMKAAVKELVLAYGCTCNCICNCAAEIQSTGTDSC